MRRRSSTSIAIATAAAATAILGACEGPPTTTAADDASLPDVAPADAPRPDASAPDAPPVDAALPDVTPPDAAPVDGFVVDGGVPDADPHNPHGIHFTDVTLASTGSYLLGGRTTIDLWGVGSGAAAGDVDGDGDLDLVLARNDDPGTPRPGGPSVLLRNVGTTPEFALLQVDPGLSLPSVRAHGAALGDFDRDGDLDAFIAAEGRDYLMENDGAGNFADVTTSAGVAGRDDDISVGALFVDTNRDGLLDLYVYNHSAASPPWPDERAANRLHLNLGDGTFADVSSASGTDTDGSSQAAAAFALDGPGSVVLYVANDRFYVDGAPAFGMPDLIPGDKWYRLHDLTGEGVPIYQELAVDRAVHGGRSSMGIAIGDVDGDLTPDVYVTDWGTNDLYVNPTPGGPLAYATFLYDVDVRRDSDGYNMISWGARFLDLDRDGANELFVVNGGVTEPLTCDGYHQLDWMLRQDAIGGDFHVITRSAGFPADLMCFSPSIPVAGRGAVMADFDGDGDDDLVITPYVEPYRVFRNDTPLDAHHELRARLVGRISGIDPAGATITVTRDDGTVGVGFRVAGGDTFSQSDSIVRVGMGNAGVTEAVVSWPSGLTQRIDGLAGFALDTPLVIEEPDWLSVDPRVADAADATPLLRYAPVDAEGAPLGAAGAGRTLIVLRSDGLATDVVDHGDGTYTAELPHPGVPRRTVLFVSVDGVPLLPRPMINFR